MGQKYKVFINAKRIVLTAKKPKSPDAHVLPLSDTSISDILNYFQKHSPKKMKNLCFLTPKNAAGNASDFGELFFIT